MNPSEIQAQIAELHVQLAHSVQAVISDAGAIIGRDPDILRDIVSGISAIAQDLGFAPLGLNRRRVRKPKDSSEAATVADPPYEVTAEGEGTD